jgi:hypothetical protein
MTINEPRRPRSPLHDERGSALVMSLTASVLLVALGSALILIAMTETAISAQAARASQLLSIADAAVERAVAELNLRSEWNGALSGAEPGSLTDGPPQGVREARGTRVDLTAETAAIQAASAAKLFGGNNPAWQLFIWGPAGWLLESDEHAYAAVWVGDDPAERDDNPFQDGDTIDTGGGVMLVAAQAFGAGGARRAVEVVVERRLSRPARVISRHEVR